MAFGGKAIGGEQLLGYQAAGSRRGKAASSTLVIQAGGVQGRSVDQRGQGEVNLAFGLLAGAVDQQQRIPA